MNIPEDRIRRSVEELWSTVLGLAIEDRPGPAGPGPAEGVVTGCVQITGAWQGSVALDCGPSMARRAAAILFGIEPSETTFDQVQDALGELTNILGGQFKSLLPEPCRLSLPAVAEGLDNPFLAPEGRVLARLAFACADDPVGVTIVGGTP